MRLLIDECLTNQLVGIANDYGYEAHHVAHLQMAGNKDWEVASHAWENDFVLVTNNSADFLRLYAHRHLHSGLVIVIPNVPLDLQRRLFAAVLDHLSEAGEPINQAVAWVISFEQVDSFASTARPTHKLPTYDSHYKAGARSYATRKVTSALRKMSNDSLHVAAGNSCDFRRQFAVPCRGTARA